MIKIKEKADAPFILIVDNGVIDRKAVSASLQMAGFYIEFESNVEDAFKTLILKRPFFILINLDMPKMNTCTFSRILKNDISTDNIKIVAFSDAVPDVNQLIYCCFDGFLNLEKYLQTFAEESIKFLNQKETIRINKK